MHRPLISIIIPFYNRANTLSVCIDSVLNARYKKTEIILIDDGSTDESGYIGFNYSSLNANITYIHQSNSGVSKARNKGLELAKGEWVTFIDSDDVISPYHFDIVECEGYGADLLMVGAKTTELHNLNTFEKTQGKRIERSCAKDYFMSGEFNPFHNIFYSVWDKFFRINIIKKNNLAFDETMTLGEDQSFVCDYLLHAKKLIRYTKPTYVCVKWDTPIEHLGRKLRHPEDYLFNQRKAYCSLKKLSINITNDIAERYAVDFGINRPISRILYGYAKSENSNRINRRELLTFLDNKLIPFIRSIKTNRFNARNIDIRISRIILLNFGARPAFIWAKLWINHISPIYNRIHTIITMPKNYISYRLNKASV